MIKSKTNIAIIGVLLGLCSGVSASSSEESLFKQHLNKKAKSVHVKVDIEKQGIAQYFIDGGLFEAAIYGGFELKQRKYPEPITLGLKRMPSAALKLIKATQEWEKSRVFCYANGWASYDSVSKRVLVNVESISCWHSGIGHSTWFGGWKNAESSNVGAKVNGLIFGADFVKGVKGKINERGGLDIGKGTTVLIKFEKADVVKSPKGVQLIKEQL